MLSIFAGLATFLAALGVFGCLRRGIQTIGNLGAQPQSVKRWISAQIVRKVGLGCVIGLFGAYFQLDWFATCYVAFRLQLRLYWEIHAPCYL